MLTLLDCINRIPEITEKIICDADITFAPFFQQCEGKLAKIRQIVLIGSGTSNNAAITARKFMEKTSGIQTICVIPNVFLNDSYVYSDDTIYIFISQSGTSIYTLHATEMMNQLGNITVGITENDQTQLAQKASAHIDMGCGKEEYRMRTIGYCSSVLTLMLLGLKIGERLGRVSHEEYTQYIQDAKKVPSAFKIVVEKSLEWYERNKEQILGSKSFTFYGGGSLWGVSLEAALKMLEITSCKLSIGYEADDGMHGPTMGFSPDNCVIFLNDNGVDSEKGKQLILFAKEVMHNGFMFGMNPLDETDLAFEADCGEFNCLVFSPAIQILPYKIAEAYHVNLVDPKVHKELLYFKTHTVIPKELRLD